MGSLQDICSIRLEKLILNSIYDRTEQSQKHRKYHKTDEKGQKGKKKSFGFVGIRTHSCHKMTFEYLCANSCATKISFWLVST